MTTIEVTADDIKKGKPREGDRCAVALAVKRALGRQDIWVSTLVVLVGNVDDSRTPSYLLSEEASAFVIEFDRPGGKKRSEPFTFELNLD